MSCHTITQDFGKAPKLNIQKITMVRVVCSFEDIRDNKDIWLVQIEMQKMNQAENVSHRQEFQLSQMMSSERLCENVVNGQRK